MNQRALEKRVRGLEGTSDERWTSVCVMEPLIDLGPMESLR